MKTKLKTFAIGALLFTAGMSVFTACNGDADVISSLPSSATIRTFSLEANDSILNNLDSVFFTIDLYNLEIFNADSLPYGTKVTALTPVIQTESASAIDLTFTDKEGEIKTLDYFDNITDTVDFTNPVKIRVVSYDQSTERTYTVRVNVHQVPTDTLVWQRIQSSGLPTPFSAINRQHTTMSPGGTYYCMTVYQNEYALAMTSDPSGQWDIRRIQMPFDADINSLTATNDALYIMDTAANLYTSSDNGSTWIGTGRKASHLLGAYGNKLLGTTNGTDGWFIFEYPSGAVTKAHAAFPVVNTSNTVSVTFEMSTSSQLFITGGRKADGTLSKDTWGYDGKTWANVTRRGLPEGLENMALVPYFDIVPDTTSWRVSSRNSVLLAMFGNRANGIPNDTIYMSRDYGMNWSKAPEGMQITPSAVPSRTMAQAYPFTAVKSRASRPITEWEVPYIYLFGGVNTSGATYNTLYSGVITAFTFKPLQ